MRPVDIARKLEISTTTLRGYEERGLVPPTSRTLTGASSFILVRYQLALWGNNVRK